jgi:hypothetical protein
MPRPETPASDGADPARDWVESERAFNRLTPSPRQQRDELAAYQKIRQFVGEHLSEMREGLNAAALREALERARARMREAGQYTADTVDSVAATIEKEIADTVQRLGPTWEQFSEKTAGLFNVWRDRGGVFLSHAAIATGDWLREAGARLERRVYRSGEMTAEGAFECTGCGQRVELETPAHLPPCPGCQKTEYRRV